MSDGLYVPTDPIGIARDGILRSAPAESYLMGVKDCLEIVRECEQLYDVGGAASTALAHAYKRIGDELI